MAWNAIGFVGVGDLVSLSFINGLIANLEEDDIAKVEATGDIIVASAANQGTRLPIGNVGDVLISDTNQTLQMKWAGSNVLSGTFITWGALKTYLGLT